MPKYLCLAAVWVEAANEDEAADAVNDRLSAGLRAEGTVGKVMTYTEAQTRQDGFLLDAEKFELGEVVVPPSEASPGPQKEARMLNTLVDDAVSLDVYRVIRGDGKPVPTVLGSNDREDAERTLKEREVKGQHPPYRIERRTVSLGEWFEFVPGSQADESERTDG